MNSIITVICFFLIVQGVSRCFDPYKDIDTLDKIKYFSLILAGVIGLIAMVSVAFS